MHSALFKSTFLRVLKYLQIKEGGPNFWLEPILQKLWIIWAPLLYLNFKSFMGPNSSSFIRFQRILQDPRVLFSESCSFYKLKRGELIFQKVWIIWSPLLYFNLKSFMEPNSLSLIKFQCILPDSWELFSESWNFYKLKTGGDLISAWNQFSRKSELFGHPFCISILEGLWR